MSYENNAGPAFPCDITANGRRIVCDGMTLRDYFAAKAMPVILGDPRSLGYKEVAECCYRMADAMLEAREES